jgi:hypothetical protein
MRRNAATGRFATSMTAKGDAAMQQKILTANSLPPATAAEPNRQVPVPDTPEARAALDWLNRGAPQDEIVYDDDAPRLIREQLGEFEPAKFKIGKGR